MYKLNFHEVENLYEVECTTPHRGYRKRPVA